VETLTTQTFHNLAFIYSFEIILWNCKVLQSQRRIYYRPHC